MKDRTSQARLSQAWQSYELSEQEIRSHWIWSLCRIVPGDLDELIRRVADRCQGVKLDLRKLKEEARLKVEGKTNKKLSHVYAPGSIPLRQALAHGLRA